METYISFHFLKREEKMSVGKLALSDTGTEGRWEGSVCCREAVSSISQGVKPDTERVICTPFQSCIRARIRIWVPAPKKPK